MAVMELKELNFDCVQPVLAYCIEEARKRYDKSICVAVCDAYGFLLAFGRADGAPVRSIALSQQKAYTAVRMGSTSAAFLERLRREDIAIGYFCDSLLTALPGGSLIRHGARVVGGVGISGLTPSEDQALADDAAGFCERALLARGSV
jgi:glc operon protein GlcG